MLKTPMHASDQGQPATIKKVRLDRSSYVPFYRQIADQMKEIIQSGEIAPGEPFWSEGDLAAELAISRMTIRQAFQILRSEGLLTVTKGRRPVVGAGRLAKNTQELRGFSEEMSRRGLKPASKLLSFERRVAAPEVREALELGEGDEVFAIRRLRLANDQPMGVELSCLPAGLFAQLERRNLEKQSLYSMLELQFGMKLSWSEEEIEAVPADKEVASLLRVKSGAPLLCMKRKVYNEEGTAIEYGQSIYRGDRYIMTVVSRRNSQ